MHRRALLIALAALAVLAMCSSLDTALAQKSGGTLRIYHRDTAPGASIHEEATTSTLIPFMGVYNNLVM